MMHNTGQSTIIRHRELVTQVTGSTGFTVQNAIVLNPGIQASFPWLASIASNYQEYEWRGLVFHFMPTSGTAVSATSAALGTVMLQTTYRSSDSAPESKVAMMNEYWANEVVPFDTMAHPIECSPKENPFNVHYVRSGNPVGDPLLYDLGTTYVATQGQQSAYVVGDLWVTYEVELKKPMVASNVTALSHLVSGIFTTPTTALPFNSTVSTTFVGALPVTFSDTGRFNVPAGYDGTFYAQVIVNATTTFTAAAWTGVPTYTNAAAVGLAGGFSSFPQTIAGATATATCLSYSTCFSPTDSSKASVVNLPTPSWTGTAFSTSVVITYVP